MTIFYIYLAFILIVLGGIAVYFLIRLKRRQKILDLLQLKLFLVRLPYAVKDKEQAKDVKEEINLTEQLISSFAAFKKPFVFEVAVPYVGEEIHFYVAVPLSLA